MESGLKSHKKEILAVNKELSRLFRRAYSYLAGAKLFLDEVKAFYSENGCLRQGKIDKLALELTHKIFEGNTMPKDSPRARHLFATAITPAGPESHLETIVGHLGRRYIIKGDDGTGKNTLVNRLMDAALMRGFDVEAYHCALDPTLIDHLVVPELNIAVINDVEPHHYLPHNGDIVVDTNICVNEVTDEKLLAERNTAREMYRRCMSEAVVFINRAKKMHDLLENYYVPHMNFDEVNRRREDIMARIMDMADKKFLDVT